MVKQLKVTDSLADSRRLKAVEETELLDTPEESVFDDVTNRVCAELNAPICLLTIIDMDRQYIKSQHGLGFELKQMPLSHSICKYVVHGARTLAIDDMQEDPDFRDHPVTYDWNVSAYLGTPIVFENEVIGALCAVDYKPRTWTKSEIANLQESAATVQAEIYMRTRFR